MWAPQSKELPWKVKAKFGFSLPSGVNFDNLAADFKVRPDATLNPNTGKIMP